MGYRAECGFFVGDDVFSRLDGGGSFDLGCLVGLFFPPSSCDKQFVLACGLVEYLLVNGCVSSRDFKTLFPRESYNNLVDFVVPKLERFGLIKVIGERRRGKAYVVELNDRFYLLIHRLGLEWLRIYYESAGRRGADKLALGSLD